MKILIVPSSRWFDKGNHVNLFFNIKDEEKLLNLYKVDGLACAGKKIFQRSK